MNPTQLQIRNATPDDAGSIQAIYRPIVEQTIISFEDQAPSTPDIASRIASIGANYPYLVAEHDGRVVGYAYADQHRTRPAYRWSVDVSAYVSEHARRSGVARALYDHLLAALSTRGFHAAFAGITLPNPASVALHESMGFACVGVYREVGFKCDRWLDVGWWQRLL